MHDEKKIAIPSKTEKDWPTFKYDTVGGNYREQLNHSVDSFNQRKSSQRQEVDIKDYCQVNIKEVNYKSISILENRKESIPYNLLLSVTNQSPVSQYITNIQLEIDNKKNYLDEDDRWNHPFIYHSLYKGHLLYSELDTELEPGEQIQFWISFQIPKKIDDKEKQLKIQFIKNIKPIDMVIPKED